MNGPDKNVGTDWRLKWPDPAKLAGRTARHTGTRRFIHIHSASETGGAYVSRCTGPGVGLKLKQRQISLEKLARLYNLIPEGRT